MLLGQLDVQRIMRWIVSLIAFSSGLLTGALVWKAYILTMDEGVKMPEFEIPAPPALQNPGWGAWLDLAKSQPPVKAAPKPVAKKPTAKPINTQVNLAGIIGYGKSGIAIMQINNGKDTVYNQGDKVEDGITLARIVINGVILSNGETEKAYYFAEDSAITSGSLLQQSTLPQPNLIKVVQPPKLAPLKPSTNQSSTNTQPRSTAKAAPLPPKIQKQIEELREQPIKIAQHAKTEFVRQDGQIYGVRISQLRNPELFRAVGLRDNDLIIAVNGITVPELARDPVRAQAMLSERTFQVDIIRNGQRQVVNFTWPR